MHDTPLGPGPEFDAIREMLRGYGAHVYGTGDDAAVLDVPAGDRLVVSTDAAVELVHFRREWMSPEEIGYRAAAAALSDLAAMAARPLGLLVAIGVPPAWRAALGEIAKGIGEAAARSDATVVGGNVTRAAELSITTTVFGTGSRLLFRSGAQPGESLWVTGRLGGSAAALRALERGQPLTDELRERFFRPQPRIAEARWLAEHGATAAIDISDGLLADARHLAQASGVRIEIELDHLPTIGGTALEAAASGEEYELAVCAPASMDASAFERAFQLPLTAVGRVIGGQSSVEVTLRGERVAPGAGHDHFSS